MSRIVRFAAVGAALLAASACTPTLRIHRSEPPSFYIAPDKTVGVEVVPDGSPPTVDTVLGAALDVAQGQKLNKWLAVEPVREQLPRHLASAFVVDEPARASYLLRATPTEWSFQGDLDDKRLLGAGSGTLYVRVEILDPHDRSKPPLYAAKFWGSASGDNELQAMLGAARYVSGAVLRDLTPRRISEEVELDDDDPVVEPGIDLCESGQFDAAHALFSDLIDRHPRSAPAHYNLAVLKEARGEYADAEDLYVRAIQLQEKPLYYAGLERMRRARRDAQAFGQMQ